MTEFLHDHESFKSNIEKSLVRSCDLFTLHEASSFCDKYAVVDKKDWERAYSLLNMEEAKENGRCSPPPVSKLAKSSYSILMGSKSSVNAVPDPSKGIKHDSDKPRFDLLPADALEEVAKVYAVGAKEYGDRNWELGMNYGRLFRALMSHAWAWWRGERDDSKNKLHHLTSVVFNALALLHYELNSEKFKKFDDRK